MITPEFAKDKTWIGLVLWQLLWPGVGQIYLGQKNKGITYAALVLPLLIVSGLLSFVPGIGILLGRVVFLSSCGIIIGESFAALAMLQMGGSVIRDKWIPRAQQRHIIASMPSDLKSKWIKALAIVIFACGKNGERSRKASLHAFCVLPHQRQSQKLFTQNPLRQSLCQAAFLTLFSSDIKKII